MISKGRDPSVPPAGVCQCVVVQCDDSEEV